MNIFASLDPSVKKLLGWKLGDEEEKWALKAVESLVKKLRKRKNTYGNNSGCGSVEDLEYALAHPGSHSKCVTIPRSLDGRLQVSHRKGLPHVIYCRVWRWPNLQSHHELKPTSDCLYPYDSRNEHICINPYHYQRIESSLNNSGSTLQQNRNSINNAIAYPNSPPVINGSLINFPSSSLALPTTTATSTISSFYEHQICQQQQLVNQPLTFSPPANHHQQQQQQQPMTSALGFTSQHQLQQQMMLRNSPPSSLFFGGTSTFGSSSINGNSNAQSPSALSDDDDFSAIAAAAAAAAGLQLPPTNFQFNNFLASSSTTQNSGNGHGIFCYDQIPNTTALNVIPTAASNNHFPNYWCSICYYELNSRVGEPFKVLSTEVTVDGFTDPSSDERRICLGLLSNVNRNNTIECTRRHIGKGVRFTCTDLSVVVVNLSESPVFVQSRNSNFKYNLQSTAVCRVPSNASMVIFDFQIFQIMLEKARAEGYNHVYDLQKMCFIRMSFVKGWGVDYHRQDVTSTPCWIEIQLHRPLAWIDAVLAPMNPPDHLNITSVS